MAICGACGSGKSTLGGRIRKQGFGCFAPYQIAMIDDSVMSLNLFLIRPKIKFPTNKTDNLKPFLRFLPPYVKIVFYISANLQRLEFADILVRVSCDEQTRIKRIKQRERGNPQKIQSLIDCTINDKIPYHYKLELDLT